MFLILVKEDEKIKFYLKNQQLKNSQKGEKISIKEQKNLHNFHHFI